MLENFEEHTPELNDDELKLIPLLVSGFKKYNKDNTIKSNKIVERLNDYLIANEGNDTLSGNLGNDVLDGGDGVDWAFYVDANAGVKIDLGLTGAQGLADSGKK